MALPPPKTVSGETTQVPYANVFGAKATIKATLPSRPGLPGTAQTAESVPINIRTGPMFDCEITGSNLPSGRLGSLQYNGSIVLKNIGFAPWTLYRLPENPNRQLTFAVRVDVYDNPQGTGWIANGKWFPLQPQDPTKFVRTGETSAFAISYQLPNRSGQLYLIFNFDQYVIGPGALISGAKIKTLLSRQVQVQ